MLASLSHYPVRKMNGRKKWDIWITFVATAEPLFAVFQSGDVAVISAVLVIVVVLSGAVTVIITAVEVRDRPGRVQVMVSETVEQDQFAALAPPGITPGGR